MSFEKVFNFAAENLPRFFAEGFVFALALTFIQYATRGSPDPWTSLSTFVFLVAAWIIGRAFVTLALRRGK
jgi:hypothetical protein